MRCSDIEELLSAYADDELPFTQKDFVEEHLAACADCRATLEDYRLIRRQLTSLRETPAPAKQRQPGFFNEEPGRMAAFHRPIRYPRIGIA